MMFELRQCFRVRDPHALRLDAERVLAEVIREWEGGDSVFIRSAGSQKKIVRVPLGKMFQLEIGGESWIVTEVELDRMMRP